MSTCNRLDLETLGSQNSPRHLYTRSPRMYVRCRQCRSFGSMFWVYVRQPFFMGLQQKAPKSINMWWNLSLCSTVDMPQFMVGQVPHWYYFYYYVRLIGFVHPLVFVLASKLPGHGGENFINLEGKSWIQECQLRQTCLIRLPIQIGHVSLCTYVWGKFGFQVGYQKDICYKEIELCAQNMLTVLSSKQST